MSNIWPLTRRDKDQFDKLKAAYENRSVTCEIEFDVEVEVGWFGSYYRATCPASEHDLTALPVELQNFKFLSYPAQTMHTVLYDFLQEVFGKSGKRSLHLPAVLCAVEFLRWVDKLGLRERADESARSELCRRVQLINELQISCDHGMAEHLSLLHALCSVRCTLQGIQAKWGFFQAQETIQENLKSTYEDTAQVLRSLLVYLFYVLRGDSMNLSFDPATFLSNDVDPPSEELLLGARTTLSGKIMEQLLNDPYVNLVVAQEEGSMQQIADTFPRMDRDDGRQALELAIGAGRRFDEGVFEDLGSGFVTKADCGVAHYELAVELLLRLHTKAAALARCVKLMKSAHKMASLGGDQLLALLAQQPANKNLMDNVFSFARKELGATTNDCGSLHDLLLQGHLVMKSQTSSWFHNYGFERWSNFFSFANKYRENICTYAQKAIVNIDSLSERIAQLSHTDIQTQLDAEAQYFQVCAVATLSDYGDLHSFLDTRLHTPVLLGSRDAFQLPMIEDDQGP